MFSVASFAELPFAADLEVEEGEPEIPPTPDPAEGGPATFTRTGNKVVISWEADADGEVDETSTFAVDGRLTFVEFDPDGTDVPTDGYDVWLFDADRHDVLLGQGVNRSASTTQRVGRASLGAVAGSTRTLAVRNAGDGGKGVVTVHIK